jgi:hypothetical protein
LSIIQYSKNFIVRSIDWGYLFLRDPIEQVSSPSLTTKTNPVSETFCFMVLRILDDGQNPKTRQF